MEGSFSVKRYDPFEEGLVLNDFSSNVSIVINGKETNQDKLVNELYYQNPNFNRRINSNNMEMPKRQHVIPDTPKPIEPGQVDPESFFGNSLKGLI